MGYSSLVILRLNFRNSSTCIVSFIYNYKLATVQADGTLYPRQPRSLAVIFYMQISKNSLTFFIALLFSTILFAQKGGGHSGGHGGGHSSGGHAGFAHGSGHSSGGHAGFVHRGGHSSGGYPYKGLAGFIHAGGHSTTPICPIVTQLADVDFQSEIIKFKNGDTARVSGIFSAMVKKENNKSFSDIGILLKAANEQTQSFISFNEIEYVRINVDDKSLLIKGYVEFSRIDTTYDIWRKIADDKAKVYDNLFVSNEKIGKIGDRFRIATNDKVYSIYRYSGLRTLKGKFKHFINNRYKEHFKKKDFPSTSDMIKYIAQRG